MSDILRARADLDAAVANWRFCPRPSIFKPIDFARVANSRSEERRCKTWITSRTAGLGRACRRYRGDGGRALALRADDAEELSAQAIDHRKTTEPLRLVQFAVETIPPNGLWVNRKNCS